MCQFGLPRRGRGGRQCARRGHGGRAGGALDDDHGSEHWSRVRASCAAPRRAVQSAAGYGPGGGAAASAPGSTPRGPSRAPPPARLEPAGKLRPGRGVPGGCGRVRQSGQWSVWVREGPEGEGGRHCRVGGGAASGLDPRRWCEQRGRRVLRLRGVCSPGGSPLP